jgi:hypothetical protein
MSWDIFIQDLPPVERAADIPESFRPGAIGERGALVHRLRELLPEAEVQDELWFFVRKPDADLSIVVTAEAESVTQVLVHVHDGAASPALVARIVTGLGLRALDSGTGELFDPARPEAGYEAWLALRSQLRSGAEAITGTRP